MSLSGTCDGAPQRRSGGDEAPGPGAWGLGLGLGGYGNKKPRQIRGYPFGQIKVEGVLEAAQIRGC